MRWFVRYRVPSLLVIERLGEWAGYVDLGVVRESEVRLEDLKIVRSLGSGIKSDFCGDGEVVIEASGIITQLRDMVGGLW